MMNTISRAIAFTDGQAACLGRWDVFDGRTRQQAREALALCRSCPLASLCADVREQLRPDVGVWAGQDCDYNRRVHGRAVT